MSLGLRIVGMVFILTNSAWAWNEVGHKIIAQIAYYHLHAESKKVFNGYNHALDVVYPQQSFVNAAVWLDTVRYQDIKWYDRLHYVNWTFTKDDTPLPAIESVNALSAIDNALKTLMGKYAKNYDRGIALRVLIHVVGDIHQPMHATTLVSAEHPRGDAGGNLYPLQAGPIAKNLHSYWDKGGGILISKDNTRKYIQKRARDIMAVWPCDKNTMDSNPQHWLEESHHIGISKAYTVAAGSVPDKKYAMETQQLSEQRLAQAGCRLALLLNEIKLKKGIAHNGRYH